MATRRVILTPTEQIPRVKHSQRGMRGSLAQREMALLGICHRTIHTVQRPEDEAFLLRKPLPVTPVSFGERIRAARLAKGYTQTEMARKFGVSLSSVKFWEQGRTQPLPTMRHQVEAFLKQIGCFHSTLGNGELGIFLGGILLISFA